MRKENYLLFAAPVLIAISFALATSSYFAPISSPFNSYETAASLIFWFVVVSLVLTFPLRRIVNLFSKYLKRKHGLIMFVSYSSVHLILYGLLLEVILGYVARVPPETKSFSYYFASTLFYPLSFPNVVAGFGFNPSLSLVLPPFYNLGLSLFSVSLALIIAILVTTNIMRVVDLGSACSVTYKSRSIVLLPALGVIGGAACCLSLPVLISFIAPSAAIVNTSPIIYYIANFVFPPVTAIALKFNMDSTDRMANRLEKTTILKPEGLTRI